MTAWDEAKSDDRAKSDDACGNRLKSQQVRQPLKKGVVFRGGILFGEYPPAMLEVPLCVPARRGAMLAGSGHHEEPLCAGLRLLRGCGDHGLRPGGPRLQLGREMCARALSARSEGGSHSAFADVRPWHPRVVGVWQPKHARWCVHRRQARRGGACSGRSPSGQVRGTSRIVCAPSDFLRLEWRLVRIACMLGLTNGHSRPSTSH